MVVKQDVDRQQVERQAKDDSREVRTEAFAFYIEAYQNVVDDADQIAGREKEQDVRQRVDLLSKVVTAILVKISNQGSRVGSQLRYQRQHHSNKQTEEHSELYLKHVPNAPEHIAIRHSILYNLST